MHRFGGFFSQTVNNPYLLSVKFTLPSLGFCKLLKKNIFKNGIVFAYMSVSECL